MSIGHGYGDPSIAQLAVFLYNRVGQLRDVLRILDQASVQVYGLTVSESADCAIVRLIPSDPASACFALRDKGYALAESEVLAVATPGLSHSLLQICQILLRSEVNILQAYPIMLPHRSCNAVVLSVDARSTAIDTLRAANFEFLDGDALKGS
jgi:hypothetical protein